MPDVFTITLLCIVLVTLAAAIIRRVRRDKCLRDFAGDEVTLEEVGGKVVWGNLRLENTGLELVYGERRQDAEGHDESSFILYKNEYPNIQALVRYHEQLSEAGRRKRTAELRRTYHPRFFRRFKRRVFNFFKAVRDALLEVANLFISRVRQSHAGIGTTLQGQDKYVSQIRDELIGTFGTSYEPLLERYIGHRVVVEVIRQDKVFEYSGVLKEYTADFVEVMDVDYKSGDEVEVSKADLIVLRKYGVVRHLGE